MYYAYRVLVDCRASGLGDEDEIAADEEIHDGIREPACISPSVVILCIGQENCSAERSTEPSSRAQAEGLTPKAHVEATDVADYACPAARDCIN